jgi:hypothetical protein
MPVMLEPGNPRDFQEAELDQLARELQDEYEIEVEIAARPERGYGVTLHEVIHLWVDIAEIAGGMATGLALLRTVGKWARERWQRDRDEHPGSKPRPRTVTLYDAKGRPLKRIRIDLPVGEALEEEPSNEEPRTRPT